MGYVSTKEELLCYSIETLKVLTIQKFSYPMWDKLPIRMLKGLFAILKLWIPISLNVSIPNKIFGYSRADP